MQREKMLRIKEMDIHAFLIQSRRITINITNDKQVSRTFFVMYSSDDNANIMKNVQRLIQTEQNIDHTDLNVDEFFVH